MRLAEVGKLTLDDPVNDHLPPDLRIPDEGSTVVVILNGLRLLGERRGS
jgi:CubicO group peptidase (beta-lactamase class C family)